MTAISLEFSRRSVPVQVVSQVDANEHASWRGVDAHVVGGVVEELGAGVPLHVVTVVVAPPQLDVQPVFLCRRVVHHIPAIRQR